MGLENFTPQIWTAKVFVRLRKNLVHAATVNRDYEEEVINFGDTVHINEFDDVTIDDYTKYGEITWQEMNSATKTLLIDQQKTFSPRYDDVDKVQNKPSLLDQFASSAAYAIANTVDQHLAGMYAQAGNSVSALTVTVGNVMLNLSNMQLELNEADVPPENRFVVVPPWYHQHLVNAATQSIASTGVPKLLDNGVLINGYVGQLYGFNILMSNNVNNNGTVWNIMAYNRSAITHAAQLKQVEAVRIEKGFGDGIKGLYVYGSKVVRPNAMVSCAATKG